MNKKIKFLALACIAIAAGIAATSETQAQSTTTVRFRLSYGTTFFGDIDVELFDVDKPNTVANFLEYVDSGAYDNSILHELIPGVALVGGLATVPNPYSSAPFELMARIPENVPILNEFGSGMLRSNVLGTLSMLKETNTADSATSRWFFNLGNNTDGTGVTNLDTYLGGHTVFGQVKAGTSLTVLQAFNSFAEYEGIQNTTNEFHFESCALLHRYPDGANVGFPALPVGFTGLDCIRYNDLFNVQISVVSGADKTKPKVTITVPASGTSVTTDDVTVSAVVSDNVGVESVRVYMNTNAPVAATGSGVWTATLTGVPAGTNVVVVEAIDTSGNRTQVSRTFFHSIRRTLSLMITDPNGGAVRAIGFSSLTNLEVGRGYGLVALPDTGFLFGGWTGTVRQASASLKFIMESNTALTALFVPNPFPAIKGTYNGLFYNTNGVEQQSSGFLTLTLGSFGTYSAKLLMNGKTHRFTGGFAPDGGETNFVTRLGTNDFLIRMAVDVSGGSDHISGIVSNYLLNTTETNIWQAELMGDRAVPWTNGAPLVGSYTMLIPMDTGSVEGPTGDGFGRVTVSARGSLSFNGTLADGTKAVQKTKVSKTGNWPLYLSLHKGKGALVSWVNFDTSATNTDFTGLLSWIKQSQPTARYYPGGFTNETEIAGSRYIPATGTNKVVNVSDAVVEFTGGNLAADFTNSVTLGPDSRIVNNSGNKLTMSISKSTGRFTGSVTPPDTTASVPYKGVVLQKSKVGGGFFLGTNAAGRVLFLED